MPRLVFFYMLPHTVGCMCSKGITSRKSPTAYSGLVATGKEKGTTKKAPPPRGLVIGLIIKWRQDRLSGEENQLNSDT